MVSGENHAGVLGKPELVQGLQYAANAVVHLTDRALERGDVGVRFGNIGEVARHADPAGRVWFGAAEVIRTMRLLEPNLEIERRRLPRQLAQQADGRVRLLKRRRDRLHGRVAERLGRVAIDQVLHADQRRRVSSPAQKLRGVCHARTKTPVIRRMRQTQHARAVRVQACVQRRSAWAALRCRAVAVCKAHT
jgi:hypothetical protein